MLSTFVRTVVAVGTLTLAIAARADDSYYRVRIDDLKITEGELPKQSEQYDWRHWRWHEVIRPYAVLDGQGKVYVRSTRYSSMVPPVQQEGHDDSSNAIFVCTSQIGDVTGRLYLPKPDASGMAIVKFTIPSTAAKDEFKKAFYQAKENYYNDLMRRGVPGGAWFRHELRQAQIAQHKTPEELNRNRPGGQPWVGGTRNGEVVDTYTLFSGGRA